MSLDFGNVAFTQERRTEVAKKLLSLLLPHIEEMDDKESRFVRTLSAKYCTSKQLQWLQRLEDKYL